MQQCYLVVARIAELRLLLNFRKGNELKAQQAFVDEALERAFIDFYSNFLTPKEIRQVIEGRDIWMGKDEVVARLAGTFTPKTRKVQSGINDPDDDDDLAATLTPTRRGRPTKGK